MKNKILIRVYVSKIDEVYELYIPVNETVKKVYDSVLLLISEYSETDFDSNQYNMLVDPDSLKCYLDSSLIRDTNIRNSKLIVLI